MTRIMISAFALAILSAAPLAAKPLSKMSKPELIQWATDHKSCGDRVVDDATYEGQNRLRVVCREATGFVPLLVGALGGGGGAAAAAIALGAVAAAGGGGNNNTNNTQ